MGVISQLEDGHFFLEDLTGAVPVDLSNAISLIEHKVSIFHLPKSLCIELYSVLCLSATSRRMDVHVNNPVYKTVSLLV